MGHKDKRKLAHVGARVRVANEGKTNAERWIQALEGTIAKAPRANGAMVRVNGEQFPRFVLWADMDVMEKPRPVLQEIPLAEIWPSRWQYRRTFEPEALLELAKSIERHGLINAVLVYRHEDGGFELIAGERRLRALAALALADHHPGLNLKAAVGVTAALGWWNDEAHREVVAGSGDVARAEVREGTAEDWHEVAVIENLQRENPSPIEEAEAFNALMCRNDWTQSDLAGHLGKSAGYISQRLALLELTEEAQAAVHDGAIPFASARAIGTVPEALQRELTDQVRVSMASPEPATTRKVQALAGQVKRFFEPERWEPGEDDVISAVTRNSYRLIRYHIEYLLAHDTERAGAVMLALQDAGHSHNVLLGKKPATIAGQSYLTTLTLNILTGADHLPHDGPGPYWAAFAQLKGYTCDGCQCSAVAVSEPLSGEDRVACPRWAGESRETCTGWIGPDDPVMLFLNYRLTQVLKEHGADLDLEVVPTEPYGYMEDIGQYRDLVEYAGKLATAKAIEAERRKTHGYLDAMMEYWRAQPHGLGSAFDLTHAQAHACRRCRHYRPEVWEDPGWAPCLYAIEPLIERWGDAKRAPGYAVLVREDGLMVPRCERFEIAEMPALAPVQGVQFPTTKTGRALVLEWLGEMTKGRGDDRHGSIVGPLAWLPYERPREKTWDRDLMLRWARDNWAECGGDRGVARLFSVALSEHRARDKWERAFDLMDPITGEVERWAAVGWSDWRDGDTPYTYPDDWPKPEGVREDGETEAVE